MKNFSKLFTKYGKIVGFTILSMLMLTLFSYGSIAGAEDSTDPPLLNPIEIVSDGIFSPDVAQLPKLELQDEFLMQDVPFDPNSQGSDQEKASMGETGALHFRSGDVLLEAGLDTELEIFYHQALAESPWKPQLVYVVVQYSGNPTPAQVVELNSWGYKELDYIPEQAMIVSVLIDKVDILARQPYIHAVVPMRPEWKYAPSRLDAYLKAGMDSTFKVSLVAFEPLDLDANSHLVRIDGSLNYNGVLSPAQIQGYLNNPLIKWIEPSPEIKPNLATSVNIMQIDDAWSYGLDGTGVSVGVIDGGINKTHAHFSGTNLVFAKNWENPVLEPIDCVGHGTHVAGTIGGSSTFNGQTLMGVAPELTLIIEKVFNCGSQYVGGTISAIFDEVADRGADVINNSWGSDTDKAYDIIARDVDVWAHDNELVTIVFSNGNYPDSDNTTSPALAKNVISVGATQDGSPNIPNGGAPNFLSAADIDLISTLNNLNLPEDGRTKPDINAPGEWITSADLGISYSTKMGTSMAAPHISGLIALFLEAHPNFRSDQIKAALLNSAVYLGNKTNQTPYPQGFGRANAIDFIYKMPGEAVDSAYTGQVGEPGSGFAQEQSANITVPSGAVFIKVTMTYIDKAGSTNANPALVNNLDLRLKSPSGTNYTSTSSFETVEDIRRNNPEEGIWTVYVKATDIPGTDVSQKYAFQVSVVTESGSFMVTKPSSVTVTKGQNFSVPINRQAANWFIYGVYSTAESLNAGVSLVSGQRSADVVGDMFSQSNLWSPVFAASSCGSFTEAIRIKTGGTSLTTSTTYVDVKVKPGPFNKSGPANGATNQPINLTFTWGTSSCTAKYLFCIDTTNDNTCSTTWFNNGTSTSETFSNLSPGTTYYWHVYAQNDYGFTYSNGSSTAFRSFTTAARPGSFNKSGPSNGATNQTTSPTISWGSSSGVNTYDYCYDTTNDNDCSNWTSNGASTSKSLSGLNYSTTYYWHVRATNNGGTTFSNGNSSTAFWSFTTQAAPIIKPGAFNKSSPSNGATNQSTSPTLSWGSSSGVTTYYFCYDTSNDNDCTNWTSNSNSTSKSLSGLSYSTTYYWHVRAANSGGDTYSNGNDAVFWSFTTQAAPVVPPVNFNKFSPSNGSYTNSISPTLSWGSSSGVTTYYYCYDTSDDDNCSNWISNDDSTSKSLSGLSYSTTYYWHVRATNGSGTTYSDYDNSTAFWSFTTPGPPPGAFNKIAPLNGDVYHTWLSWGSSSNVSGYYYCYDTTNDNACTNWTYNGTSTSKSLSGLSYSTTYYWHVRANNSNGDDTYSNGSSTAFWSFTTQPPPVVPPGAFNKSAPSNGATNQSISPTLIWGSSSGATTYEYCYDTTNDDDCSNWVSNSNSTSKSLGGLSYSTSYFWHVRATNNDGTTNSNASSTAFWSFTTRSDPASASFCNTDAITIDDGSAALPYPSTINLTGLDVSITDVNVRLLGLTHTWPSDIDMLLVGPQGQNLIIMSDAAGDFDLNNVDLTFDDSAGQYLPNAGPSGGVYLPTNSSEGDDIFPSPAPSPSFETTLSTFNGTDPNGTWSLYIVDDFLGEFGEITGGWCLDVTSPTLAPPKPTGLSASDGTYTNKVSLSWAASSGATSYKVYRSASSLGTKTLLGSPTGTTFNDTSAIPGVTYYYWVKACNSTGCSSFSMVNTGWRKLSPPTNVNATDGAFTDKISLSWAASSGTTIYKVYRSASRLGIKTLLGSPTGTTFNDTSAIPGVTYYYWVKTCRGTRCSSLSMVNTGWRKLSPPTNLQASDGVYANRVRISWAASSGATSYKVFRSNSATSQKILLGSPPTGRVYNDTTATPGKTYYYWVKACRGTRCSIFSVANSGWRSP